MYNNNQMQNILEMNREDNTSLIKSKISKKKKKTLSERNE